MYTFKYGVCMCLSFLIVDILIFVLYLGNILRRAGVSSGDYSKALLSFQMAVENMRVYVKKAEDDVAGEHVNDHVIEEKKANLHIFRISLASRLMNYGDCLKDARMLQESLATIEEAYLLYEGEKDIPGMLKCMGIKGLIYTELNEELAAHDILLRCKEIAYEGYEKEQNEVTVVNVQRAHLNLALHHYKLVRNTEIKENSHSARREGLEGHDELRKYLELTLHHLYTCLTLSNRIDRVVQSSCLVTLEEVYTKYYGEQGEKAVAKLYDMYPILLKLGSKINIEFVIDGSGTMFGERIEACQRILLDIVEAEMKNGDTIGVTLFEKGCVRLLHTSTNSNSNSNLNIIPLGCKISPKNREKILEEISLLSSKVTQRGVNNRHFYSTLLEIGKQIVASRECQQKWVIALTDGADTEKKTSLTDVKSFYVENGIKLIIIVVDIEDTMTKLQIQTLASEAKLFIDCKGGGENIANALEHGLKLVKNANISVEDLS